MKREEFTKATKRAALERSGGLCEAMYPSGRCNAKLLYSGQEFDHILACSNGGDNSLDNVAVLCPNCHSIKTKVDIPRAAKTVRIRDKHLGITRSKHKWPKRSFGT